MTPDERDEQSACSAAYALVTENSSVRPVPERPDLAFQYVERAGLNFYLGWEVKDPAHKWLLIRKGNKELAEFAITGTDPATMTAGTLKIRQKRKWFPLLMKLAAPAAVVHAGTSTKQ